MEKLRLELGQALPFLPAGTLEALAPRVKEAQAALESGTCPGADFLGWMHLPSSTPQALVDDLKQTAATLRRLCDIIVVAGIGGSYLGARAIIEALAGSFTWLTPTPGRPVVLYAGNNISEDYLAELCQLLSGRRFGVINISKSGTTTETALAFRLLRRLCEQERGRDVARQVIVAVTDAHRGAARKQAEQECYKTFVIPDNVGGRFSVLTPVGLLPIACVGYDIEALLRGAADMEQATAPSVPFEQNVAEQYAALRNALYESGKKIELLANFQPKLHSMNEWWKQLYGESEGKQGRGIFPAAVDLTTDLHSMGQWVQDGERTLFETVISVAQPAHELRVPHDEANLDGLNFLEGKRVDEVNKMAELGTQLAHVDGGVPNVRIVLPRLDEYALGQLVYFFERACGISGLLLGINPFDQPGVEAYKRNMFALLNKPGYEAESEAIKARLACRA